jgi:flagellar motor switch protein FliM
VNDGLDTSSATLDDLDLDAALDKAGFAAGDLAAEMDLETVLNAGADDEQEAAAHRYDFNRPRKISRIFAQNLQNVAEQVARLGTISLTNLMRASTVVEFKGIRLGTFGEYIAQMPNPTSAATVALRPLNGLSLIHIDLGVCFVVLKKLMGGRPDPESRLRSYTEIERAIYGQFVGRINDLLKNGASRLLEIRPELVGLENNPNYLTGLPPGETAVTLGFQIKLESVEGPLELCIPLSAFGPVRDVFDPEEKIELRSTTEVNQDRVQILDMIQGTSSELVAVLGVAEMSLDAILALNPGDLLHLPQAVGSPLVVQVEGKDVFLGQAGRVNQNRAVKLIRKLVEE